MSVPVRCGQELRMSCSVGWKQIQGCISQGENSQGSWAVVGEASGAQRQKWWHATVALQPHGILMQAVEQTKPNFLWTLSDSGKLLFWVKDRDWSGSLAGTRLKFSIQVRFWDKLLVSTIPRRWMGSALQSYPLFCGFGPRGSHRHWLGHQ